MSRDGEVTFEMELSSITVILDEERGNFIYFSYSYHQSSVLEFRFIFSALKAGPHAAGHLDDSKLAKVRD